MKDIHQSVVRVAIELGMDDKGGWHWRITGDPGWDAEGYFLSGAPAIPPAQVEALHGSAQEAAERALLGAAAFLIASALPNKDPPP